MKREMNDYGGEREIREKEEERREKKVVTAN